jgi:hypothetical protein
MSDQSVDGNLDETKVTSDTQTEEQTTAGPTSEISTKSPPAQTKDDAGTSNGSNSIILREGVLLAALTVLSYVCAYVYESFFLLKFDAPSRAIDISWSSLIPSAFIALVFIVGFVAVETFTRIIRDVHADIAPEDAGRGSLIRPLVFLLLVGWVSYLLAEPVYNEATGLTREIFLGLLYFVQLIALHTIVVAGVAFLAICVQLLLFRGNVSVLMSQKPEEEKSAILDVDPQKPVMLFILYSVFTILAASFAGTWRATVAEGYFMTNENRLVLRVYNDRIITTGFDEETGVYNRDFRVIEIPNEELTLTNRPFLQIDHTASQERRSDSSVRVGDSTGSTRQGAQGVGNSNGK